MIAAHFLLAEELVHARMVIDFEEPRFQVFVDKDIKSQNLKRLPHKLSILRRLRILRISEKQDEIRDSSYGLFAQLLNIILYRLYDRQILRSFLNLLKQGGKCPFCGSVGLQNIADANVLDIVVRVLIEGVVR